MRVLAPRRLAVVARLNGQRYYGGEDNICVGLPLDNETIDFPDYFNQVTSGLDVNDVIHAKVVDAFTEKLVECDQDITYFGKRYRFMQSASALGGIRTTYSSYFLWSPYHEDSIEQWVYPSANYKGRKSKTPYKRVERVRKYYHFLFELTTNVNSSWSKQYLRYFRLKIFALPSTLPQGNRVSLYNRELYWYFGMEDDHLYTQNGGSYGTIGPFFRSLFDKIWKDPAFVGFNYSTVFDLHHRIVSIISRFDSFAELYDELTVGNGTRTADVYPCTQVPAPTTTEGLRDSFLLEEPSILGEHVDPLLLGKDVHFTGYWRSYLTQHALLDACESLPKLNDNSIQNILEIVSFIKSLVIEHRIEMPHSLSDAWLQYRYSYNTTKADVEEAIHFFSRMKDLDGLDRCISSYGRSSHTIQNVDVSCRCGIEISPKQVSYLAKIWRALDTYGLTPDFYVIWDSTPYSFMVDWFLPIGNIASVIDANQKWFSGELYDFERISYSFSYIRDFTTYKVKYYSRWKGSVPSALSSYYWLEPSSSSSTTWMKRLFDTESIFIGV